jgi:hypothetical protein
MTPFTKDQLAKLDELGGLGMPLKHALLAAGVSDNDLGPAMGDKAASAAHRAGALRLAQEVTSAMSKEALSGNTSAAKLLLGNQTKESSKKRDTPWRDDLARTKLGTFVDVVKSVGDLFERQRALWEKIEAERQRDLWAKVEAEGGLK